MNDGVETFIATRRGGATKAVWLDNASRETISIMDDFKTAVSGARSYEWLLEGSLGFAIIALIFPNGGFAREITKEALRALGLAGGEITIAMQLHACYIKADDAFLKL